MVNNDKNNAGNFSGKTAVIGIGNAILSDDALGIKAVRALKERYFEKSGALTGDGTGRIEFMEVTHGGINLMEHMRGFSNAIIVDSIVTGKHKAGTIFKFVYPEVPQTKNTVSTHDMDLHTAMEMGKSIGIELPSLLMVFAVEASDTTTFSEELTEDVANSMTALIKNIEVLINI